MLFFFLQQHDFYMCFQVVIHNNSILFCCNTLHFFLSNIILCFSDQITKIFPELDLKSYDICIYVINEFLTLCRIGEIPRRIHNKNSMMLHKNNNLQLTHRMFETGWELWKSPDRFLLSPRRKSPKLWATCALSPPQLKSVC